MLLLALATPRELNAALPDAPRGLAPGDTAPAAPGGRQALALVTGVGPVAAALHLGRLLGRLGPSGVSGVVCLGLAGSFDTAALPLRTIAAVASETWPEYGLRTASGVDASSFPFPVGHGPEGPLGHALTLDPAAAALAMGLRLPEAWPTATALTVAGVSADSATATALQRRHGAALENMEGYALALACREAGLPFLEIRTVSNAVGTRDKSAWDLDGALATLPGILDTLFAQPGGAQ